MRSTPFLLFAFPLAAVCLACSTGFSGADGAQDDAAASAGDSALGGAGGSGGAGGNSSGRAGGGVSEGGVVVPDSGTMAQDAALDRAATVDAAGPVCKATHDCAVGQDCLFDIKKGCAAEGVCMPGFDPTKPTCNAISLACSCSGHSVNVICNGFPNGYYAEPIAHSGGC